MSDRLSQPRPRGEMMIDYTADMVQAYYNALKSPDPSTQNGSVLIQGSDRVDGCNEFPEGVSLDHWHGPKDGKYARVVHAEVSSILKAGRIGIPTRGATLVCPWAACSNCAKHIVYAGVDTLVRHKFANNGVTTGNHWYNDCLVGDEIMNEGGVQIVEIDAVTGTGVEIRRDGNIWTP